MIPIHHSGYPLLGARFALWVLLISSSLAQQNHAPERKAKAAPEAGRSTFSSYCAGCHGLDGSGSDKAVNISAGSRVSRISDAELSGIILHGVPGTGMPAFRTLTPAQIRSVVGYLRSLQGKAGGSSLPGNATRGKEVFFGKGDCSRCHTVSGEGGFLGPDLTEYGATASATAIRDEIVRSPRAPARGYRRAVITTANGERIEGLIRNEDNFSIQLQSHDGTFHFAKKAELQNFERLDSSLMPTTYREQLNDTELNDLVSYLLKTPDRSKPVNGRKKEEDWE